MTLHLGLKTVWLRLCNELRNTEKLQLSRVKSSVSVLCIVSNLGICYMLHFKSQKGPSPLCGFKCLCKSSPKNKSIIQRVVKCLVLIVAEHYIPADVS